MNDVDAVIGGLAEEPVAGSLLGALFSAIICRELTLLRDQDPWHFENENVLDAEGTVECEKVKQSLLRNRPMR